MSSSQSVTPAPAVAASLALAVLEGMSDAAVILDRELRYLYVNESAARLFGRSADSLVGALYLEEYPAAIGTIFHKTYLRALQTGEPARFEAEYGPWGRRFENRVHPTPDGLVVLFSEIVSDRPSAIPGIGQAVYLRTVLDASPDCLTITDRDTAVLDMSASGLALLEVEGGIGAVRGRRTVSFVEPEDQESYREAHAAAFEGYEADVAFSFRSATGRLRRAEKRLRPLYAADGAILAVFGVTRDVTEQVETEDARRASEALLETILARTPFSLTLIDHAGIVTFAKGGALETLGLSAESITGKPLLEVMGNYTCRERDGNRVDMSTVLARVTAGETVETITYADNGTVHSNLTMPFSAQGGEVTGVLRLSIDITAQQALEERLRQAQKMEAIGQLAGGVAHDFNNLLTIITGHLEFARADLAPGARIQHDLDQIAVAAERARTLVRQLLTFSRKQPIRPRPLRVGEVVRGAEKLLRRVIGEEIVLDTMLEDGDALIVADAGQIEQVLMNLAVNARDAMLTPRYGHQGEGGTLTIETGVTTIAPDEATRWSGILPGRFVLLRVQDTGHGMDAETIAHAFEPFFTTKGIGEGTGLGLATVFGIVQQSGGSIRVDSTPGRGATFTIVLPLAPGDVEQAEPTPPRPAARAHDGACILLVEDETSVRVAVRRMLERRGYAVLEARHGADALQLWRDQRHRIDALITDLRMPEMGGRDLAARLRTDRPTLPIVFVSGYTAERDDAPLTASEAFIEKPFNGEVLLDTLARVLQPVPALDAS